MSKEVIVNVVHAFCDGDRGGNPAGVVQHPGLSKAEKQFISAKVGFSETVFISPSEKADYKLEFFTTIREVPDCGHATLAAYAWLIDQGQITTPISSKETMTGVREIQIRGNQVFMEFPAPTFSIISEDLLAGVAHSLGFRTGDLDETLPAVIGDSGLAFCMVPVVSSRTLEQIRPKKDDIGYICSRLNIAGYLVFSREALKPDSHATSRMFAPAYGIHEEAATGTANAPLAAYLRTYAEYENTEFIMEQGFFMDPPCPSRLQVELDLDDNDLISRILIGGEGLLGEQMVIEI